MKFNCTDNFCQQFILKLLKFKNAGFLQSTCEATMTSDSKLP